MVKEIHTFLNQFFIFDFASLVGFLVTLVGFLLTLLAIRRTRNKVNQVIEKMTKIDAFSELSSILAAIDELKELHLREELDMLPKCCSNIRKRLISIRGIYPNVLPEEASSIQSSITFFNHIEGEFILYKSKGSTPEDIQKRNNMLNQNIDGLQAILVKLKNDIGREENG
jgi:hypothetical protein